MKDFLIKHPVISLLGLDIVVTGILNLANIIKRGPITNDEARTTVARRAMDELTKKAE